MLYLIILSLSLQLLCLYMIQIKISADYLDLNLTFFCIIQGEASDDIYDDVAGTMQNNGAPDPVQGNP